MDAQTVGSNTHLALSNILNLYQFYNLVNSASKFIFNKTPSDPSVMKVQQAANSFLASKQVQNGTFAALTGGAVVVASDSARGAVISVGQGAANLAAEAGVVVSDLATKAGQCAAQIPGFFGNASKAGSSYGTAGAAGSGYSDAFFNMFSGASEYAGRFWSSLTWGNQLLSGLGVLGAAYLAYKYLNPASGINLTQNNNNTQTQNINLKFELGPDTEIVQKKDPDGTVHLSVKQLKVQKEHDERFASIIRQVMAEHAETMKTTAATAA
jgi:hypothetical protein